MAEDDGSRRPSQPSTPVNPAGVGASASNRGSPHGMVSPSILQEILESGNQGLIDDALEQWDATDMGRLLSTLPSPARASPAGVGSAASDLGKVKKNHGDADAAEEEEEEEEEDEDVRPVPIRRPPCHGHHPVPPNKAPLKRLSIKPICNDGCACCSKTKNKLLQDDASPTSPPPTAS